MSGCYSLGVLTFDLFRLLNIVTDILPISSIEMSENSTRITYSKGQDLFDDLSQIITSVFSFFLFFLPINEKPVSKIMILKMTLDMYI